MGIRSLAIPANPQPQNVASPIPGVDAQRTLNDVLGGFKPTPMAAAPAPAPGGSMADVMPQMAPPPVGVVRRPAQDQSDEDFNAELEASFKSMNESLPAEAKKVVDKDNDKDFLQELDASFGDNPALSGDAPAGTPDITSAIRAKVSLGRNDVERGNMLIKVFGDGNVELRNGEFFVNAGKGFQPFNSPGFNVNDLGEAGGPMLNVLSGIAGSAGVASALSSVVNPASMVGKLGVAALSGAAGGAVAPVSRDAAVKAAGIEDPTYRLKDEIKAEMGVGAVFGVGGEVVGSGSKWLKESWGRFRANQKFGRPEHRALVTQRVREVIRDLQNDVPYLKTPTGKAGAATKSAVIETQGRFGAAVRAVDEKAVIQSADQKFKVQAMLDNMKKTLDDAGVIYDPKTNRVRFPESTKSIMRREDTQLKQAAKRGDEEAIASIMSDTQSALANEASATGFLGDAKAGPKLVKQVMEDYPKLVALQNSQGGVPYKMILDQTRKYQDLANFDDDFLKNPAGAANSYLERIVGGSINDRQSAVNQIFKEGTPEHTANMLAYQRFAENADRIASLKAVVRSTNDPAQIADAVFSKQTPDLIRNARHILGPASKEWNMLRGAKISDMIEKSITPEGVFSGDVWRKQIKDLGPDVVGMLGSPQEIMRLNRMAAVSSRINVADLMQDAKALGNFRETIGTTMGFMTTAVQAVKNIFKLSKGRVDLLDYVADDVLDSIPRGAGREYELEFFNEVQKNLQLLRATGKTVKVKRLVKDKAGKMVEEVQEVLVPTSETTRRMVRGLGLTTGQAVNALIPAPESEEERARQALDAQMNRNPMDPQAVQADQLAPREE